MAILVSAGIDITEVDYSDYVSDASISVFGIVGGAKRGPMVPTLVTDQPSFIKTFGEPDIADFGAYSALALLANANEVYYQRVAKTPAKGTSTVTTKVGEVVVVAGVEFDTKYHDSTLNTAVIKLSVPDAFGYFDYTLETATGTRIEYFGGLTATAGERYFEAFINSHSDYVVADVTDPAKPLHSINFVLGGGADGISGITAEDVILAMDNGFSNPDTAGIDILITPGWTDRSVIAAGITLAENRQDILYIFDPPFGLTAQNVVDWCNATGTYSAQEPAFNSSYAATYWPWVQINDAYTGQPLWLPPSGYVAAQVAYSDSVAEPWFAPAGLNRGKLTQPIALEVSPTLGERNLLYGNQNVVNPLMNVRGQGLVIWGQKTTQREPSATNRVNVRRLMNYLKKIVSTSTLYFVFEPNDEYSWERWYEMVEPQLQTIKTKRGIYDFKIEMDATTVTQDDIDNHRMPGVIKVKPTKTAEFIPLGFMIMPNGADFSEMS